LFPAALLRDKLEAGRTERLSFVLENGREKEANVPSLNVPLRVVIQVRKDAGALGVRVAADVCRRSQER
jgi:hypothetical protein